MELSERITNFQESATILMASKAREMKAKGIDVISLSLGEPDFKTPNHIQQAAKHAIDSQQYFSYPPVAGYMDLRVAIAKKLNTENNIPSKAENVVVSNGAKQSIANVIFSLVNPGDEVIVFSPYWVSYSSIIQLAGGTPVFVKGHINNGFKVKADQLKVALTNKTKAILYSSPCNPTGAVFSKSELEAISDVIKDKDIIVISDEIYEYINYTSSHVSMASLSGMAEKTVTVNGFSKGFAMTGWRIGYISAPQWIAKGCIKMQGETTSANCSIAQRAAISAIQQDMTPTNHMAIEYRKRRDLVYQLLCEIPGFKVNMPDGAFYFFPDVSTYFHKSYNNYTIKNAGDLCMYLLEECHVSLVMGEAFGNPNCIRFSYAASESDLKEAVSRVKLSLAKLS